MVKISKSVTLHEINLIHSRQREVTIVTQTGVYICHLLTSFPFLGAHFLAACAVFQPQSFASVPIPLSLWKRGGGSSVINKLSCCTEISSSTHSSLLSLSNIAYAPFPNCHTHTHTSQWSLPNLAHTSFPKLLVSEREREVSCCKSIQKLTGPCLKYFHRVYHDIHSILLQKTHKQTERTIILF